MKQDATILVCCHKDDYFYDGDNYLPIQVGKDISSIDLGIQGDNVGDNISVKNRSYCELTAMYWAWKNLRNIGYIGLNHYRRYFNFYEKGTIGKEYTIVSINEIQNKRLSIDNIDQLFSGADVILSKQKSYPYSLEIDYSICHLSKDIKILREVISELSPEYIVPFDKYVRYGNKLSHYNMFLMRWEIFDKYCNWLFKVLQELERRIDISSYDAVQQRIFGYIAERLLGVFIYANNLKPRYYPIYWVYENRSNQPLIKRLLLGLRTRVVWAMDLVHYRRFK